MGKKKLIEVALPLDKINAESAREKSIRHGHPSTLHLWWARRPLAAARAVIWSSLVDDPSSHPEKFPTEEAQNRERQRLFKILEDLVVWENSNDDAVLDAAKAEIMKSTNGNPPALLDPFGGGGTIPLEAQRLGLKAHAHDLNPVAVAINKATIEVPPRFAGLPPVNKQDNNAMNRTGWRRAAGLVADVKYYGEWMKQEAFRRIGHLYPKVKVPKEQGGGEATVIAWVWTRTVKCPNPACGCEMPLASSFVLSKKKGKEAWIAPQFDYENKRITYTVKCGKGTIPDPPKTSRGAKFKCIMCGETTLDSYIKEEALDGRMSSVLMGVIAEGMKGRVFVTADELQHLSAKCGRPDCDYPEQALPYDPRNIWCVNYGLDTYDKLFSDRQLHAMTTFSSLVAEAQLLIEQDAIAAGMPNDHIPLSNNGCGARAYSEAVGLYLAFAVDREANYCSTLNGWSGDFIIQTFGRQALPMVWDYAESNPFSNSTGNWSGAINWVTLALEKMPASGSGIAKQFNAQDDCMMRNIMVSTDPPYYDNIGYADLSDYFYVWMRRSIKNTFPELFGTLLVPKAEELIATPYRHDGKADKAKEFFENGMFKTCCQICKYVTENVPVTIYYAYKQSDTDTNTNRTASTGWETMLSAIINSGFLITGTWPIHTERETGLKSRVNALASSIILVCRKRSEDAPQTTRRNLINILRRELRPALKKLQDSNIAPVDLAQSAIGPGMGVFSRYRRVLEADGSVMTVRSALQVINEEVDLYFNDQVGSMDAASRFCVDLYTQCAYNNIKYGEAEILANAKSTSIPMMASHGVLYAKAGVVHLLERADLPERVDINESNIWLLTQQLTHAMTKGGVEACAKHVADIFGSNAESAKDLAYRLYTIAERKGWTEEAYAYNALVVAWPDIQSRAADLKALTPEQMTLF